MSSSASSTEPRAIARDEAPSRFTRGERSVARLLVVAIATMTTTPVSAGDEFDDPNHASFDASVVGLDNSIAGETTFTIDTTRTVIEWRDLQQPEGNVLDFHFLDPTADSAVLNRIGATRPPSLEGTVLSNGTVAFASPFGLFIGANAVLDVGSLVAVGSDVSSDAFLSGAPLALDLTGAVENHGLIRAAGDVALIGRDVLNAGTIATNGGYVWLQAGERLEAPDWDALTAAFFGARDLFGLLADGEVVNEGRIVANDAALVGGRVVNRGEIEIADGSLMMVAADGVYLSRFDDPVFVRIPHARTRATGDEAPGYAIENEGRIDAGRGHVRLAASDPLGFGIRQGAPGATGETPSIHAGTIELEGGDEGRVHLSGRVDASDDTRRGEGGSIDVTGAMIVLADATLDASGMRGGGSIRVGGEQQGGGTLQRARSVVVDADSEIRADADRRGDGGRIIVFSEDLTIVDGDLSATGGRKGGDGGFIETSGLRNFAISSLPDVSARRGEAGGWLIDPYDITIRNAVPTDPLVVGDCSDLGDDVSCGNQLNAALLAILDPDFDPLAFDGILRTIEPGSDGYGGYTNVIDPDLLARALAIGTDVTLSTQAFGLDREADGLDDLGNPVGNITIEDAIVIDSDLARRGTAAKLVLLAAAGIRVDADIRVDPDSTADALRRVALDVELRANDLAQADPAADFSGVLVNGDVLIDADVVTGGGDFTASGIGIELASGRTIDTDGGAVLVASGSLDATGQVARIIQRDRRAADLATVVAGALAPDPHITIAGDIDTTRDPARRDGGNVTLNASSIDVQTSQTGDDPVEIVTGQLTLTGSVTSGGGDVILRGGIEVNADSTAVQSVFVGNVDVAGGSIDSGGGDVRIRANRVDPEADAGKLAPVFVDGTRNEGGDIKVQGTVTTSGGLLEIGDARTRSVSLDGTFDTTDATDPSENGLLRVLALDASDPEVTDLGEGGGLGEGRIAIGTLNAGPTELVSAGITITSRDVVTSSTGASNDVVIRLAGDSSATAAAVDAGTDPLATAGRLEITGDHRVALFERTTLAGETIAITTAAAPLSITDAEADDSTLPVPGKARLVLGGDAATGVLLAGDFVTIAIGDGTTPGTDGLAEETGTLAAPTDFGIARQTTALWNGLSLRDYDAGAALGVGSERPEELSIRQDGDLSIVATAPGASTTGQIALALVFGSATIGANGMLTTLESSDGILTIEDASALANDPTPGGGDDGLSRVVLRGGLFLPTDATTPPPGLARNPIVLANPTPFDVDSLTLSSPAELTIDDTMAAAFGTPRELVLEAGRNTAIDGADGRGTLTLGVGTGFTLHASERLALHAGGNGSGDLVFADPGLTLAADEIELRAGSGDPANAADPSEIVGLQSNGVELLDGSGVTELGADASTAVAFSFRQDASIDVQTALPDLDQLVDVPGASPLAGVTYSVRSDAGQIDLDDGVVGTNEAERFASADLELVGLETDAGPAIAISSDFALSPDTLRVLLGGVGNLTYDQTLAAAFNREADPLTQLTLRAGLGRTGTLRFDRGAEDAVRVVAERIDLVAGDGAGPVTGSSINASGARFVLSGERAFTWQVDRLIRMNALPDESQFDADGDGVVVGDGELPRIFAIRASGGLIDFPAFDTADFTIDTTQPNARLILEAESITLTQSDGDDLALTTNPNLNIRLRANELLLEAYRPNREGFDGRVLADRRVGETLVTQGVDTDFDARSLLIEAFDTEADVDLATTTNLSTLSEDPNTPGTFDLALGRGPTTFSLFQDGVGTPDALPDHRSVSGLYGRVFLDDADDLPIATTLTLQSVQNPITIAPENVENARVAVIGRSTVEKETNEVALTLESGAYTVDALRASSNASLLVQDGTTITANDLIRLEAGTRTPERRETPTQGGHLCLGGSALCTGLPGTVIPSITLQADQIVLAAGPGVELTDPDADGDGARDPIPGDDTRLSRIDFSGLLDVVRNAGALDSLFQVTQSADLDTTQVEDDFLAAFNGGDLGADRWERFEVASVQGGLVLDDVATIADAAVDLVARADGTNGRLVVDVPTTTADPTRAGFADFQGTVELVSRDLTLRTGATPPAGVVLDLADDDLRLVSTDRFTRLETDDERFLLRDDPDVIDRAIVRYVQAEDLALATLPDASHYLLSDGSGSDPTRRDSLERIDIVLETTGTQLTLDDDLRDAVTTANLGLVSAGDVAILLATVTPGFESLSDYAALQLASLDVDANGGTGTISVSAAPGGAGRRSIATRGDQRFDGALSLEDAFFTDGRSITFTGDIERSGAADIGLDVATRGRVSFGGDVGAGVGGPLAHLAVTFDGRSSSGTPSVTFDRDGTAQTVRVRDDVLFYAYDFSSGDTPITSADALHPDSPGADVVGRDRAATFATIGKASGDLTFETTTGDFAMGTGEKLAVGGSLTIDAAGATTGSRAQLGDVGAIELHVIAETIDLLRRESGVTRDRTGETQRDAGPAIVTNVLDFDFGPNPGADPGTPNVIGSGRGPIFGLPDLRDANLPSFDRSFAFFAATPDGTPLTLADFTFASTDPSLVDQVPSLVPRGASRSDLSGAEGPRVLPTPSRPIREPLALANAERLLELAVEARETSKAVQLARLEGAAIIDDLGLPGDDDLAVVTGARVDARDAELAIELYEELFGRDGERRDQVRGVLQGALDDYLATTRARRVVGFELRRFVKNRPSSLLEAYSTLEALDSLFRYHRRLGLSPGEYRRIQREWLREIQPDGITLDELAEAIHPSRYVRGSDILDIFGR